MGKVIGPEYGKNGPAKSWNMRLFVTDQTPRCILAYQNLKKICEEYLDDECVIEVVDILLHPDVARKEQIVAVPTLFKLSPKPQKVLVGDFSQADRVIKGLGIKLQ